jgi:hypothetical protein
MIKDLLSNAPLMRPGHILWNDEKGDSLTEINTDSWWSTAMASECQTETDVLWPLGLFIDRMKISNLGSLRLEPISFTFSRYRAMPGEQLHSLRKSTKCEVLMMKIFQPKKNFRIHMTYLDLSSQNEAHCKREELHGYFSEYCGKLSNHRAVLRLPIQLIIGDCCKGHGKLCGRYKNHSQCIKDLCRDCNIPMREADNID